MKIALVLCLLSVLVITGCSDSAAPPEDKPVYTGQVFPLTVGNWWAYHIKQYTPSGRIDESEDTLTVMSNSTIQGHNAFLIHEQSVGANDFMKYYDADTIFDATLDLSAKQVYLIYPMTQGQEITLAEGTPNNPTIMLRLDSLKISLDLGFEKFYSLQYSTLYISNSSIVRDVNYFEPGIGWLKNQLYDATGRLTMDRVLVGYHVVK
jgi:hypothetical protein